MMFMTFKNKYLKHLSYIITHKFWVLIYCFKHGLYLQGILHDLSRFTPIEFMVYAKTKVERNSTGYYNPSILKYAWNHHAHHNKHHWQYWVTIGDNGTLDILNMPFKYVVEMICDWYGAGRAQHTNPTGDPQELLNFYMENGFKFIVTFETNELIKEVIAREIKSTRKETFGDIV